MNKEYKFDDDLILDGMTSGDIINTVEKLSTIDRKYTIFGLPVVLNGYAIISYEGREQGSFNKTLKRELLKLGHDRDTCFKKLYELYAPNDSYEEDKNDPDFPIYIGHLIGMLMLDAEYPDK